tara:strand:+ start:3132 stop:4451 length:1320 start_codon:yes stop_codon:yes gene_type:complete
VTRVLVVDDDDELRGTLVRQLGDSGYETGAAPSGADALSMLEAEPWDVLLTDLRMSGMDGIDLIAAAIRVLPELRPILMSAYATARDHQLATRLGAVTVLSKPFTPGELRDAVQRAAESQQGFRGSLHGLSLFDLLQMYHLGRRSVTVTLGGVHRASLHVQQGEIIHAEYDDKKGERALAKILQSESGSVETSPLKKVPRTIERPFSGLLLDLVRQADEESSGLFPAVQPADGEDSYDEFTIEWDDGGEGDAGDGGETEVEAAQPASDEAEVAQAASAAPPAAAPAAEDHPESVGTKAAERSVTMGKIDEYCKNAVDKVDGGVACGVVDLDTGMVLGVHNNAGYSQTLNEIVGAAAMDMFRGPNVSRVEQLVRSHRGMPENGEHYFEEIHVSSRHNFHFMKTIKGGKAVIVLVTSKQTSIGMGWASLKSIVPEVEPMIP